ncbi:MAG: hypothetical protein AAF378_15110 [Cyanobacteria bacterium P01_A01_bin.84]
MTQVTSQEIAQFRSQLADNLTAMEALDLIEDCDGDLEDAAMTLAIRIGQQPQIDNTEWLDSLARRWRTCICNQEFRNDLQNNNLKAIVEYLENIKDFPKTLATPVIMYVLKKGINNFCESFDSLN